MRLRITGSFEHLATALNPPGLFSSAGIGFCPGRDQNTVIDYSDVDNLEGEGSRTPNDGSIWGVERPMTGALKLLIGWVPGEGATQVGAVIHNSHTVEGVIVFNNQILTRQ